MEASRQDTSTSIGLLVLRLGIAGLMATHGVGKLRMLTGGQAEQFADPIGLGAMPSLVLVTGAELGCSVLVLLGLATRLAAIPVVFAMAVGAFLVHRADPWSMETAAKAFFSGASESWASKEPALLFLVPFLALAFTGAGRFSLDALIGTRWRARRRPAGNDVAVS